jgi:DNA-binding NtrC family response regulator
VLGLATAAAHSGSTVLLLGEPGTETEDVARLIHNHSREGRGPFLAVSCAGIADSLAERTLLGYEKGAFAGASDTRLGAFEAADGGTLFLDEIGDLSPSLQVNLQRVLQERAVVRIGSTVARQIDVRVVAATHRDLAADVKGRLFREDLHLRLNVVTLRLPPLRERREDIPRLARVLLDRAAARLGLRSPGLTADAETALSSWEYPGNVRELANVVERVLVLRDPRDPKAIDREDVMAALGIAMRPTQPSQAAVPDESLSDALARAEKLHIEASLRRARGVKSHAARMLGIGRPTLDKKIAELGIDLWSKSGAGG